MRWIFVGLGNPGPSYAQHRHNVGLWALDRIRALWSFDAPVQKDTMALANGTYEEHVLTLCWPLNYMNRSGPAVAPLIKKYPQARWLVFHDEMDFPCGRILLRHGGSARGHNGVKSLNTVLGPDYDRLRIGIDRPAHKEDVVNYVLSTFPPQDKERINEAIDRCIDALPLLLEDKRTLFEKALLRKNL